MISNRLAVALVVALMGCSGGIQLTERGTGVQQVTQAQMPGGCRLVGDVAIGLPPDAARPRTEEQLAMLMRNKAGEMGANYVVTETSEQRTEGGTDHWVGRGVAYTCDASAEPATAGGEAGGEAQPEAEPAEPAEGQGLDPELTGE